MNEQEQGRQMRFTDDELNLIKTTFGDNERLLKLIRKVFLPEFDPNAPLGQMIDIWMTIPIKELSPEQAYQLIAARNELVSHVDQQLIQLSVLANTEAKTVEELKAERKTNSTK